MKKKILKEFWKEQIDGCETLEELFSGGDMWSLDLAKEVINPKLDKAMDTIREETLKEVKKKMRKAFDDQYDLHSKEYRIAMEMLAQLNEQT